MTNGGSAVSGRDSYRTEGHDERKHFLVLCSEAIIHDAINEGVDRTTDVPQARREEENLRTKKQKTKKRQGPPVVERFSFNLQNKSFIPLETY